MKCYHITHQFRNVKYYYTPISIPNSNGNCQSSISYARVSLVRSSNIKQDYIESMNLMLMRSWIIGKYDSWNIAEDTQENVNKEVGAASALYIKLETLWGLLQGKHLYHVNIIQTYKRKRTNRRKDDSKNDLADVSEVRQSASDSSEIGV